MIVPELRKRPQVGGRDTQCGKLGRSCVSLCQRIARGIERQVLHHLPKIPLVRDAGAASQTGAFVAEKVPGKPYARTEVAYFANLRLLK